MTRCHTGGRHGADNLLRIFELGAQVVQNVYVFERVVELKRKLQ